MDKFSSIQAFCRVVELNGFSAAARDLGVSSTMASKYIAHLEQSLGVTLLNRTTRKVSLTEAGGAYYQHAKQLLEDLEILEDTVSQKSGALRGVLKVTAPIDFGGTHLVPAVDVFQQLYPGLAVELTLENRAVDMLANGCDIAIRITSVPDPDLIAKRLGQVRLSVYAAPDYLQRQGEPTTLDELQAHPCLHFLDTPHGPYWVLQAQGETRRIEPQRHFASNNGRVLCEAAARGMGLIQVPDVTAAPYVKSGALKEILGSFRPPAIYVLATYLQRRFIPAKISTFARFLGEYYQDCHDWQC